VCGPSLRAAAELFASGALDHAAALHRGSPHLVHALDVAEAPGGGGGGGGGEEGVGFAGGPAGDPRPLGGCVPAHLEAFEGLRVRTFGLAEFLAPAGREVRGRASVPRTHLS
jgi:hypothetical protein